MTSAFLVWEQPDAEGRFVSCLLLPGDKPAVIWYRDGKLAAVEEFEELEDAQRRTEELRDWLTAVPVASGR